MAMQTQHIAQGECDHSRTIGNNVIPKYPSAASSTSGAAGAAAGGRPSSSQQSIDNDTDPARFAVLQVECLEAKTLKVLGCCQTTVPQLRLGLAPLHNNTSVQVYVVFRILIQSICQGVWIAAFVITARGRWLKTLYDPALLTNSLVLAAVCGPAVLFSSGSFMLAIFRATRAQQVW